MLQLVLFYDDFTIWERDHTLMQNQDHCFCDIVHFCWWIFCSRLTYHIYSVWETNNSPAIVMSRIPGFVGMATTSFSVGYFSYSRTANCFVIGYLLILINQHCDFTKKFYWKIKVTFAIKMCLLIYTAFLTNY